MLSPGNEPSISQCKANPKSLFLSWIQPMSSKGILSHTDQWSRKWQGNKKKKKEYLTLKVFNKFEVLEKLMFDKVSKFKLNLVW